MKVIKLAIALAGSIALATPCLATSFPDAKPGDRTEANAQAFAYAEAHFWDVVIATPAPASVAVATRIMDGLLVDTGDVAANFDLQQALVRQALYVSAAAAPQIKADVNAIVRPVLLDYWQQHTVVTDPASQTALAIHFAELAQALLRVSSTNDSEVASAVGAIWKAYAGSHPLADSTKLEKFFSKVVTRDEYIEFLESTLAVLDGQGTSTMAVTCETSDFGDGLVVLEKFVAESEEAPYTATLVETGIDGTEPPAVAAVVAGGCMSQCMNGTPPCGSFKYWIQRFGCRQGCALLCAAAAVIENLDGGIPAFQ